ncbi:hypothetical protein ACHWQZ_G010778 [Mnemiopsis leidyi]
MTLTTPPDTTGFLIPGPPNGRVDTVLSVVYMVCSVVGIPGNVLAVLFFHQDVSSSKRKEFFRLIFLLIAYINLATCLTLPPVVEVLFREGRSETGALFGRSWFCWSWGILWEFIPFYSVFLLGVMSISRMCTLLFPLKELADKRILITVLLLYLLFPLKELADKRILITVLLLYLLFPLKELADKRILITVLLLYLLFPLKELADKRILITVLLLYLLFPLKELADKRILITVLLLYLLFPLKELADKRILITVLLLYLLYTVLVKTLPLLVPGVVYQYTSTCGFCFLKPEVSAAADRLYNITNVIQLGFPFVPICLSCSSSVFLVRRKQVQQQNKSAVKQRRKSTTQAMLENATITIIVMTSTYVIFNIPVFINYIYYVTWAFSGEKYAEYYDSAFLYQYLWNISWVLCMAGNAALNPIIYHWRILSYQAWIRGVLRLGHSRSDNSYISVAGQASV